MKEKTRKYNNDVLALPPLKMVLGDVPNPNPRNRRTLPSLAGSKNVSEARRAVEKIISHMREQ